MNRSRVQSSWRQGLIVSIILLAAALPAQAGDDFQTWHTLEIVKRLDPQWDLFFRPEIRIRDDSSDLFYHEYRQGVRWNPSKQLQVGLNYLFIRNTNTSGKIREEHTGELDVTPKTKWGPWELSIRGRVSLRTIEGSAEEQEVQVRLMPKIAYSTEVFGHKAIPYVANDAFYDYTRDAWNQNRTFLGVVIPFKEAKGVRTSVDLYYMHQKLLGKRHDWNSNHILGTKLNLQF